MAYAESFNKQHELQEALQATRTPAESAGGRPSEENEEPAEFVEFAPIKFILRTSFLGGAGAVCALVASAVLYGYFTIHDPQEPPRLMSDSNAIVIRP